MSKYLFRQDFFAESKVSEDHMPFCVQQYVLQFDVTVDDTQLKEGANIIVTY